MSEKGDRLTFRALCRSERLPSSGKSACPLFLVLLLSACPAPTPRPDAGLAPQPKPNVVEGVVEIGYTTCTKAYCPESCCNQCIGQLQLKEEQAVLYKADGAAPYTCTGTNCDFREKCELKPGSYRLKGKFAVGKYEGKQFIVEEVLRD